MEEKLQIEKDIREFERRLDKISNLDSILQSVGFTLGTLGAIVSISDTIDGNYKKAIVNGLISIGGFYMGYRARKRIASVWDGYDWNSHDTESTQNS